MIRSGSFMFFIVRQKKNKLKKIEFVSNKPSKLWKLSFGNNLSEKSLDKFAQAHFLQLNAAIAPRYWIKLTSITYKKRFETLLKTISKYQK